MRLLDRVNNPLKGNLKLGIIEAFQINCKDKVDLGKFIKIESEKLLKEYLNKLPEGYNSSRKLYRTFKIDPTKYRPSSEALYRRLKKNLGFPKINPMVDLTNFLAFKFQISYGLYDIDKIHGNIKAGIGEENENYEGLNKGIINLNSKIILKDEKGPFGNPSSDSRRTSVGIQTKDILQILFFHRDYALKKQVLQATVDLIKEFFTYSMVESNLK